MSVYRLLCGISYIGVFATLLLGVASVGAFNAAWRLRHRWVGWLDGPGELAMLRARLFTAEGQQPRRHALRLTVASLLVGALTFILAVSLSKRGGSGACWVSSSALQANER